MSRLRDKVRSAGDSSVLALAELLRCPNLRTYSRWKRWNTVLRYVFEREPEACKSGNEDIDYRRVLTRACEALNLTPKPGADEVALEQQLVEAFIKRVENDPNFDRTRFEQSLRESGDPNGAALAATFATGGVMALLSAGGFGTYVAMSTAMGAVTGLLGITLPFAVYTTASTVMSVLLGPVGWIGLGIFAFFAFTGLGSRDRKRDAMELAALCVWCAFATEDPPNDSFLVAFGVVASLVALVGVVFFAGIVSTAFLIGSLYWVSFFANNYLPAILALGLSSMATLLVITVLRKQRGRSSLPIAAATQLSLPGGRGDTQASLPVSHLPMSLPPSPTFDTAKSNSYSGSYRKRVVFSADKTAYANLEYEQVLSDEHSRSCEVRVTVYAVSNRIGVSQAKELDLPADEVLFTNSYRCPRRKVGEILDLLYEQVQLKYPGLLSKNDVTSFYQEQTFG